MDFYIIQEYIGDNQWFDLYSSDLCVLKDMILILKRKINKKYRIIKVYR